MKKKNDYTPKKLYEILSRTVIGQEVYLKKLSNAVWLHAKRLQLRELWYREDDIQKCNLLCVGPTGSGKTLAVQTLAKLYGFDTAIFNAVDFTGSGWKGRDTSEMIQELYGLCDRDKKRTEQAIVVLDEIDKMLLQSVNSRDPSSAAENSMLKLIEGMNVQVKNGDSTVNIHTKDMLFIAAGAFEGIEKIVMKRLNGPKVMGFGAENRKDLTDTDDIYALVTRDDLKNYGAGMQFLGRFADIAPLRKLKIPELIRILLDSNASVVRSMDNLLRPTSNVGVEIDEAGARAVAELAHLEKTGARGLNQILMPLLEDAIFNLETFDDARVIRISADETGQPTVSVTQLSPDGELTKPSNEPVRITCHPKKNAVENYVDYILSAYPDLHQATIREIRAAHALLCSIIFYLFLECNKDDWTLDCVQKLINMSTPAEDPEDTVSIYDILRDDAQNKALDYCFYHDKFIYLDPSYKSVQLARKALAAFVTKPEYQLKAVI